MDKATDQLKLEDADIVMSVTDYTNLMAEVQNIVDQMPERTADELATMSLEIAMVSFQIEGEEEEIHSLRQMCKTGSAALLYINILHVAVGQMQLHIKELQSKANMKLN